MIDAHWDPKRFRRRIDLGGTDRASTASIGARTLARLWLYRVSMNTESPGLTSGTHMPADAPGRPFKLIVTAGQVGDIAQAPALLEDQTGDAVLADTAYDSNALRAAIAGMRAEAVIPSNRCRKVAIPHDAIACRHRNRIERRVSRLKHFRRFATR